jgi:ribonuclease HI
MTANPTGSEKTVPAVELFTDGACSGNPGPGGWAYLLRDLSDGTERTGAGGEARTTNNRMELLSVIEGLRSLSVPSRVRLVSDSEYVVKGLQEWIDGWKKRGWRKADRSPVLNQDLWKELDRLRAVHRLSPEWIRGHRGHAENEACDRMAVAQINRFRQAGEGS